MITDTLLARTITEFKPSISPNGTSKKTTAFEELEELEAIYVSEATYWEKYYSHLNFNFEWNNGYLEKIPMTDLRNYQAYFWQVKLLDAYLETHLIAEKIGLEAGFRLNLLSKVTIRKPDLGVVLHTNPILLKDKDRSYHGIFDLCIESLSDSTMNEILRDTKTKFSEYQTIGVKEYYILDESGKYTAFYYLGPHGLYVPLPPTADGVIESRVLPGFRFRIADLYKQPSLEEMAADEVYKDFVLLKYQQAKARAIQAEAIAQAEAQARLQAESIAQAEAQARLQAESQLRQIMLNMRQKGLSPELIAELTGVN